MPFPQILQEIVFILSHTAYPPRLLFLPRQLFQLLLSVLQKHSLTKSNRLLEFLPILSPTDSERDFFDIVHSFVETIPLVSLSLSEELVGLGCYRLALRLLIVLSVLDDSRLWVVFLSSLMIPLGFAHLVGIAKSAWCCFIINIAHLIKIIIITDLILMLKLQV